MKIKIVEILYLINQTYIYCRHCGKSRWQYFKSKETNKVSSTKWKTQQSFNILKPNNCK